MKTITFYSYKGGTGRTLALANAARYLARLEFKVVAVDFDLEAPGLHYKFGVNSDGSPLPVQAGIVDYICQFVVDGEVPGSLKNFTLDVNAPGTDKPLIQVIAAGSGPSTEYWSKLSAINWHDLFFAKGAKGVQMFLDLKSRIADELQPDFLLVDSRTGITEMGGVATSLLADTVIAFVQPTLENLEGARAVLRSLIRSRRETGLGQLDIKIALSRVPLADEPGDEDSWIDGIRTVLNQEAENLEDTLSCAEIFVLHSEAALGVRESLRVGSGVSPDDSILLRDYLRLFANVVPKSLIESKVGALIQSAKAKIWDDPDAALKEVEELAESFGHPETYRELLRFYEVRNTVGPSVMRRAQRLWELTRDDSDVMLWAVIIKCFNPESRWRRKDTNWTPNIDFVESVWRVAGKRDPTVGLKIAEHYNMEDRKSRAADILLEMMEAAGPTGDLAARCIAFLDTSNRSADASKLIQQLRTQLLSDLTFLEAWAKHALRNDNKDELKELAQSPGRGQLELLRPSLQAQVLMKAGLSKEATAMADRALSDVLERGITSASSERDFFAVGELFSEIGRFEEFEKKLADRVPSRAFEELRSRFDNTRRRPPF